MSKVSIFILLLSCFLYAKIDYSYSYTLKKDEIAKIEIKKDYLPTKKSEGILKFRWTLYKADRLVLLVDYEGFKYQYILQKLYQRDRVKINLLRDFPEIKNQAYAIIAFKDFKNNKATLEVFIKDSQKRLEVRFK